MFNVLCLCMYKPNSEDGTKVLIDIAVFWKQITHTYTHKC